MTHNHDRPRGRDRPSATPRSREGELALAWDRLLLPADAASATRVCDMTGCDRLADVLVAEPSGSLLLVCTADAIGYVGEPALHNSRADPHLATLPSPTRPDETGRRPGCPDPKKQP